MSLNLTIMSLELDSAKGPITKTFTKKEITIGRLPHNDLVLDSPEISAQHARMSVFNGAGEGECTICVTDLGSTNGTHVGPTRLVPHVRVTVGPSDRIRIGNYLVKPTFISGNSVKERGSGHKEGESQTQPLQDREMPTVPSEKPKNVAPVQYEEQGFAAIVRGRVGERPIEGLNLKAKRLFTLSGKVIHRGKPLSGVTVDAGALGKVTSDAQGCFEYVNVPEGVSYNLKAAKPEFKFEAANAKGVLTSDLQVEFLATKLFSIKGTVTHNGEPLAGVEVDGGPLGKTSTDIDGCYVFRDVPEDTEFVLKVAKAGFTIICPDEEEDASHGKNQRSDS